MPAFDAIIFDFDGVLADSIKVHAVVRRQAFDDLGYPAIAQSIHDEAHVHGTHTAEIMGWTLKRAGLISQTADVLTDPHVKRVMMHKDRLFYERAARGHDAMPGAVTFVRQAGKRYGVQRLAIATAADKTKEVMPFLKRHGLEQAFGSILSSEKLPVELLKPDPYIYTQAAKKLGLSPERIAVIEDSAKGVMAAKAAGMRTYAITTTHSREQLAPASPDEIVDSFGALTVLL